MKVYPVKTQKVRPGEIGLFEFLDKNLTEFSDRSILAITSKVVSICEGNVVKIGSIDKHELIEKEADEYILPSENKYGVYITIKNGKIIASAGIDESNGNGYYILWPKNPQVSANKLRRYLVERFGLKKVGVVITDSRTSPLIWGVTGTAIAHSGFKALKSYIETDDIFGRKLTITKQNIAESLGVASVLVMGEGAEQTPITLISEIPFVEFQKDNPSFQELEELKVEKENDIYKPFLTGVKWHKGKGK